MEFTDSYYIWKQLLVPAKAVDEGTGDLRSDLLVSDEYLLSISNLVEHGTFSPPVVDVLGYLDKMMLRAKKMMAEGNPEVQESARGLHAYAALSRQLYVQYLEVGSRVQ